MRKSRQSRFATALFAIFCVLFTQIAVAGYACPSMQIAQAMAAIAAPAPVPAHREMPGCDSMEMDGAPVCQDHGQVGQQSLDKPELPPVSPFIAVMLVQAISFAEPISSSLIQPADTLSLRRATAPPLSIRDCCFQI